MKAQSQKVLRFTQRGVTLVELMVSITIGMVIVLFLSSLYLSSRTSYRVNDDSARLQDEGRAVMNIIARNLIQAGFGNLVSSDLGTYVAKSSLTDFGGETVLGCTYGFAAPTTFTNNACAGSGTSKNAFQVSYRVDNTTDTGIGAGTDCNGQTAPFDSGGVNRVAVNRFFLDTATQTLNCIGNGNATVQPLLSNVQDMQVTYGITTQTEVDANGLRSTEKYVAASAVTDWASVISVNVCLELSSPNNNVAPAAQATYVGCGGVAKSTSAANNRRVFTTISGVYTLRNNSSVHN